MPPEPPEKDPPGNEPPSPWGKAPDEGARDEGARDETARDEGAPAEPPPPAPPPAAPADRHVVPAEGGKAPAAEQLNCPNCGGTIEIKAAGYTVSVACQYCGSVLDVSDPDVRIITRYEEEVRKLELPLGSRGTLKGVEWEVIGYLRRSENGQYPWDEYLLFNPYYGYRWLDTDGRGWSFGETLTKMPQQAGVTGFNVDGEFFEPFYADTPAQVDFVLGEFYWQVAVGEEAHTADYVRPGKMLSWERTERETGWTLSEYMSPEEVAGAFGIAPHPPGGLPMPHQPSPYAKKAGRMMKFALAAAAAILLISIVFGGTSDPQTATVDLYNNGVSQGARIGPVVLTRPRQAITVSARAPGIENSWIDLEYTLTDRETGDVYEAYNVVEAYSGRDSEGEWSEGSRSSASKFSMVPAGTYDLDVTAAGSQWLDSGYFSSPGATVEVTIARGATFWSNLILALLLVLAPALWLWFKHLGFESRRKSDSDFAPDDDDDDDD